MQPKACQQLWAWQRLAEGCAQLTPAGCVTRPPMTSCVAFPQARPMISSATTNMARMGLGTRWLERTKSPDRQDIGSRQSGQSESQSNLCSLGSRAASCAGSPHLPDHPANFEADRPIEQATSQFDFGRDHQTSNDQTASLHLSHVAERPTLQHCPSSARIPPPPSVELPPCYRHRAARVSYLVPETSSWGWQVFGKIAASRRSCNRLGASSAL